MLGLTDTHLIASIFINSPTLLWTRDKRLRKAAERSWHSRQFGLRMALDPSSPLRRHEAGPPGSRRQKTSRKFEQVGRSLPEFANGGNKIPRPMLYSR
jgi:hypothetical protein